MMIDLLMHLCQALLVKLPLERCKGWHQLESPPLE
jgi:hypothetical protein